MAKRRKFSVGLCCFPYAGTSSGSSQVFEITPWALSVYRAVMRDKRLSHFALFSQNDTPVTMTRNRAVLKAREEKLDFLMMVDADQIPDCELGRDPEAKPFFESSIDFLIRNYDRGPHVVCAPYCGPPPEASVYCFRWVSGENVTPDLGCRLEMYPRDMAAMMTGIQPIAAGPTGLILFDLRAFDLVEPQDDPYDDRAAEKHKGFFYYHWQNKYAAHKTGTEDVSATRDISLAGWSKLGRDVIYANWDAWAGHNKVVCVGKPRVMTTSEISDRFRQTLAEGHRRNERIQHYDFTEEAIP